MSLQALETDRQAILDRVRTLGGAMAVIQSDFLETVDSWERKIAGASRETLDEMDRKLQPIEERRARQRAWDEEEAARDRARNEPQSEWEREEAERFAREAQEAARYARSTEGRLEAIEKVLIEIRDGLARR